MIANVVGAIVGFGLGVIVVTGASALVSYLRARRLDRRAREAHRAYLDARIERERLEKIVYEAVLSPEATGRVARVPLQRLSYLTSPAVGPDGKTPPVPVAVADAAPPAGDPTDAPAARSAAVESESVGGPVGDEGADGSAGRASSPTAAPIAVVVDQAVRAIAAAFDTAPGDVDWIEISREGADWRVRVQSWWLQHGRTSLVRVIRRPERDR